MFKGSRSLITAFMVLVLFSFLVSCESDGVVGEELSPDGEQVETNTYPVTNIEEVSDNGFSGSLNNSAMGIVQDPVYGTITSSTLMKPSISKQNSGIDVFPADYSLKMMLQLNSQKYGNEASASSYKIYEINQRWRGNEIRYNNPVSVDRSVEVGSFQVTDEDSVEVSLNQPFVDRYREFFNDTTAQRDSLYRFEFPGLAIVPEDGNEKIDFVRHRFATDDTTETAVSRFFVENEQDSLIANLSAIDWGSSMERSDVPETDEGLVLHNTMEQILKIEFDLDPKDFEGVEIVNAQLILNPDPGPDAVTPSGFVRPENNLIRGHAFPSEPLSLHSEIFSQQASVGTNLNEDEEVYSLNVTQFIIDQLYGSNELTPLYFTNQQNNGLYVSTKLFGNEAAENVRPRLIITTLNPDN
ncbi:MAG: hypothetical protein R6V27_03435 [Balneolaceae bacterium]